MRAADSARAVHLCAARCAPFIAHKWPTHALRLTQALYEIERHKTTARKRESQSSVVRIGTFKYNE